MAAGRQPCACSRLVLALVLAASAVSAQVESLDESSAKEELAEVQGAQDEIRSAKTARVEMWNNFKKLAEDYSRENKLLLGWNYKLSRDIDDSRVGVSFGTKLRYAEVPNFLFKEKARPLGKTTREGCELKCNQRSPCKSYSFNTMTQECLLSTATLQYAPGTIMYLKKELGEGDPTDRYHAIPGLAGDQIPIKGVSQVQMSLVECKHDCTSAGDACKVFIYDHDSKSCLKTADASSYNVQWAYYEKVEDKFVREEEAQRQAEENHFKHKIMKDWHEQNKIAIKKEKDVAKEAKIKCVLQRGNADQYAQQAKAFDGDVANYHKKLNDMVLETRGLQSKKFRLQSEKYRIHTRIITNTATQERAQKAVEKMTGKEPQKKVQEIFTNLDESNAGLSQAHKDLKDMHEQLMQVEAKEELMREGRVTNLQGLAKSSNSQKLMDAKATLAEATFKTRCSQEEKTEMKMKLQKEQEVGNEDTALAKEAEKTALVKKQAAENANKAVAQDSGEVNKEELERKAQEAGEEADAAEQAAKTKSDAELGETTEIDKTKLRLQRERHKQVLWKKKVDEARKLVKEVEAKENKQMDREFEKKLAQNP